MLFEMKICRFILKIPEHHLIFLKLPPTQFLEQGVFAAFLAQINEPTSILFFLPEKLRFGGWNKLLFVYRKKKKKSLAPNCVKVKKRDKYSLKYL